jgi:hypothetical protein
MTDLLLHVQLSGVSLRKHLAVADTQCLDGKRNAANEVFTLVTVQLMEQIWTCALPHSWLKTHLFPSLSLFLSALLSSLFSFLTSLSPSMCVLSFLFDIYLVSYLPYFLGEVTSRPDDGSIKHLWNVSKLIPDNTAQHPRWQSLSRPSYKFVFHTSVDFVGESMTPFAHSACPVGRKYSVSGEKGGHKWF